MPEAKYSKYDAIVLERFPPSAIVYDIPPVLHDAALVNVVSAPLPKAYENTMKPSSSLCFLIRSISRADSPSVRNKIAFKQPEVFVPLVFEFLKTSYAV